MSLIIKYFLILICILILFFIPKEYLFNGQISLCLFKNLTGIQCPLCGMTRAGYEMMHIRILSALRLNPVVFFLPLLMIIEIINDLFPSLILKRIRIFMAVLSLAGLIVLFIVRIIQQFTH
jgi:hypothetical protein